MKKKNRKRSLKTRKKSRQPGKIAPQTNSKRKRFIIFASAILVGVALLLSWKHVMPRDLESKELVTTYDLVVPSHLKPLILDNFVKSVNSLPDRQARASLISAFRNERLPVRFGQVRADSQFNNWVPELHVNYLQILPGNTPQEIVWSTLVHENVHIKSYLSGQVKVRPIPQCKQENIVKKCSFEYFLDEYRGLSRQIEFLKGLKSLHLAPDQIKELYIANDLKRSVLAILRRHYIESGSVHPYYAQYYDEFEQLMLQDEKLVYAIIEN